MITPVARAAASALALGAALAGSATVVVPAAEATPHRPGANASMIGLSPDGVSWSEQLDAPLFDPTTRWVPGDVRSTAFWVRNQAPATGDVSVRFSPTVRLSGVDAQALRVVARAGDRSWTPIVGAEGRDLLAGRGLLPGQTTPVELRVEMRPDAPNTSMVLRSGLALDVLVVDALATPGSSRSADRLPETGSLLPEWSVPVAGGFLLAGSALLVIAVRRRRYADSGPPAAPAA